MLIKFKKICISHSRNIFLIVTVLILCSVVTMGNTYAFFQAKTKALTNSFTVGEITTVIDEKFDINGTKNPKVKNIDITDCIVRMRYDISPNQAPVIVKVDGDKWKQYDDEFYYYEDVLKGASEYGKDDGGITNPLFNKYDIDITKAKQFYDEYGNQFEIILYQESVQAEIVDNEGNTIKAFENGKYSPENAKIIWNYYDNKINSD